MRILFAIISCVFGLLYNILTAAAQRQPNIVIFIADDLNQQDVGCYGNRDVRTPNMDKLAAEGMQFKSAYAASPMCAPSRSVMFTGLYPFRNGSQMNHFTVRPNTRNLPQFLQKLGYRVVISGKTDIFPLHNFPFEHIGEEFGKYAPIENRTDRKKETVNMIRTHFQDHPEQPICLIVAPWIPHVPWFPNTDFDPQQIKLPDYLADTKETRKALTAYYQSIGVADKMLGEVMQAIEGAGVKDNTVTMFIADQGAQFPSAKWSVYDQGLRIPMIVRWPGKVMPGTVSDALVSLADLTPTLVDLAGGKAIDDLDGTSFKDVLLNKKKEHHQYIFAETSMEPHFWYNYTPSRTVITKDGFHYIRNYHPGVRFITHIDKVEQNEFYFDSWIAGAATDPKTKFLLDRYSYHPPEELYDLNRDRKEFSNLIANPAYYSRTNELKKLLDKELSRQGETAAMILEGPLPQFFDRSYTIRQNASAADLSFNKKVWNPHVLVVTAYLDKIDKGGVICDYFNNFKLYAYHDQIGIVLADGKTINSEQLPANKGQLYMTLSEKGELVVQFNQQTIITQQLEKDLTKIKGGYVSCGMIQGEEMTGHLQSYQGNITDLRFTMNELSGEP
ncbi:sulfatase family protein [Chitinophaga pinensis]|uniref:Sulfatase n=1 Tax=Chitinophaga pinensis (strain ATCC 43595 / DSM 2588 / LMG 13176 / NBRC 15968 / NCIMB 11800 / UQM 2034) TaxID=485918 RepID=A0A979G7B9_CHIPD|nr:sulfatase [Chitinophaga pinensis]ACU62038.1 sulfatase [Chitinophaga pinensis DSM 2588]